MILLVPIMGCGPLLAWKRGRLQGPVAQMFILLAVALVVAMAAAWLIQERRHLGFAGLGLAAWLFLATLRAFAQRLALARGTAIEVLRRCARLPRATYGMCLAHGGMALTIAGISAMALWQEETIVALAPGERTMIAGYEVTLQSVRTENGPNYQAEVGRFVIASNGRPLEELAAERRYYPFPGQATSEVAIRSNLFRNIYVALGEPDASGKSTVRLYYHPLAPWIWLGALAMALGGVISLTDRRHRVGAPRRAQAPRPAPAGAAAE
jgi:cytochrome c-type biogenesis protein CcmF